MTVDVTLPPVFDNLKTRGLLTGIGNAAANATLIQSRINASGAGVVWVPPGTYYYNTAIKLKTGVKLAAAIRGATTLIYTGSGNAVEAKLADRPSGVYKAAVEGILFQNNGSGQYGFSADCFRESAMSGVQFYGFDLSGVYLTNSWSNRWTDCQSNVNNGSGWALMSGTNGNQLYGCMGNLNTLDGYYVEKGSGNGMFGCQAEGNGRHGYQLAGVSSHTLSGCYLEHQTPAFWSITHPDYTASSPRYGLFVTAAPDATRSKSVVLTGGNWEGAHNGTTIITTAVIRAESCDNLFLTVPYAKNGVKIYDIASSCLNVIAGYHDDESLSRSARLSVAYDYASGGRDVNWRGYVGRREGFENLLTNGGFDADLQAATTLPSGWTQSVAATYAYEAGTDGGNRLVLTNIGATGGAIYQDVAGPEVAYMATTGFGALAFDAVAPTANTRNKAQIRVRCHNGDGNAISGGGLESWFFTPSDTETRYVLPFPVPSGTTTIRVYVISSDGGASNTDVLKVDRMGLWAGETPKYWLPRPLTERGGRLFAGVQLPTKAGAFSDADFPTAPANNSLIGIDTSNNRVYFKANDGSYKYVALT